MRYFKVVFALVTFLSLSLGTLYAEEVKDSKVKLTVLDSLRREPVEFATASITPLGSTTPSKYALSDNRGKVELAGLAAGKYTIRIEYMGYITYSRPITIEQQRVVDLGDIALKEQMNTLNSVVVTAVGNPIVVKKDTIEYNASSYKTTDNDMLEELLKKLPGVEIDSDGKITANGKEINKIMIDGKTFFLNDPQLATKNIPAKIVDKVKVVERKS
ncbi:MAG: carboxypeptidase-like regulatory domain-containing protein, partial [Bacteroidales bacterium]|nr:carboxypeptidase-like regulatory domain-containing protein [Bacteroidales bacterium]